MRAVGVRLPPSAAAQQTSRLDQAHEQVGNGPGATQVRWLIAAVLAGHDGVAVLVLRQAFTAAATESVLRAGIATPHAAVAAQLVLAMRALAASVAQGRPRDAASTALTAEGLRRTGLVQAGIVGALLVGGVVAVRTSIAHEEPGDAHTTRTALDRNRII